MSELVYVVTDVELDGFRIGESSMLSFASVAVSSGGRRCGMWEGVLETLPGGVSEPGTMDWWREQPADAWRAAREDPQPPQEVMSDWVGWVRSLGPRRCFVASPVGFDGPWVDYYLRRFTDQGLVMGPNVDDPLFTCPPVCLHSLAAGHVGQDPAEFSVHSLPQSWFGEVVHTHHAVDDALGYANLLLTLLGRPQPSRTSD